jgi:CheY-like chemotaxis protein
MISDRKSILAIDDEFDIVTIIKHTLRRYGFDVSAFTEPLSALEYFQLNPKDFFLVLSDVMMPGIDGFEFARRIRAMDPTIKILLMSAFEITESELSEGLTTITKIDGFINKPISPRKLNNVIQGLTIEHML